MKRLTFEGNFCEIARCGYPTCPYKDGCSQKQVWEQLKRYEDTKRTPEQIEALEAAIMGKAVAQITEFEGLPIARLRELAVADKEGRVVVLPCKVGDTVYLLFAGNPNNPVISTLKINTVAEAVKLIGKMGMHKYIGTFRTREEAEKALEAIQNE